MSNAGPWIALAALFVSGLGALMSWLQVRRLARKDFVEELDRELTVLRVRVDSCERERGQVLEDVRRCEQAREVMERGRIELLEEVRDLRRRLDGHPGLPAGR